MTSPEIRAKGMTAREFIACSRCRASVELPANYCDMCGGQIANGAAGVTPRSKQPKELPEDQPARLVAPVSEVKRVVPKPDTDAACRRLMSAHKILKGVEEAMESLEAPVRQGSIGRALFTRIASGGRIQPEIAELHRNLDLAGQEASKAMDGDPDAAIATDDGPLNSLGMLSRVDRVRGNIELFAGKPQEAIRHYQNSINKSETRDVYFDMAVAHERIGQPGDALRAYERCAAIAPDSIVGVDALDEATRLRSDMILGGWFVGSWKIVIALLYFAALSLLSILWVPLAGKVGLAVFGGGLCFYLWAKFRRPVSSTVQA